MLYYGPLEGLGLLPHGYTLRCSSSYNWTTTATGVTILLYLNSSRPEFPRLYPSKTIRTYIRTHKLSHSHYHLFLNFLNHDHAPFTIHYPHLSPMAIVQKSRCPRCGSGSRKGRGLRGLCEEPGHLGAGQVRQGVRPPRGPFAPTECVEPLGFFRKRWAFHGFSMSS